MVQNVFNCLAKITSILNINQFLFSQFGVGSGYLTVFVATVQTRLVLYSTSNFQKSGPENIVGMFTDRSHADIFTTVILHSVLRSLFK